MEKYGGGRDFDSLKSYILEKSGSPEKTQEVDEEEKKEVEMPTVS